jgi:hypothetical protein
MIHRQANLFRVDFLYYFVTDPMMEMSKTVGTEHAASYKQF